MKKDFSCSPILFKAKFLHQPTEASEISDGMRVTGAPCRRAIVSSRRRAVDKSRRRVVVTAVILPARAAAEEGAARRQLVGGGDDAPEPGIQKQVSTPLGFRARPFGPSRNDG